MPSLDSEVAEEKELAENLLHVTFTPARVKYIVHPHASSLLATEDPVVEVSHEMKERAEKVFASHAADSPARVEESKVEDGKHSEEKEDMRQPYVSRSIVSQLMKECGAFVLATDEQFEKQSEAALVKVTDKYLRDADRVTLADFIAILARYQAPAFYYGQRLRRASGRGDTMRLVDLLVRGCNPSSADGEGLGPLHYACEFNRVQSIEELRRYGGSALLVNARCKYGWTPLYTSIHHGSYEATLLLLDIGADVNICTLLGKSPLHAAAARNRSDYCELLVKKGALLGLQDVDGMTPLHEAAFRGNFDTFEVLRMLASESDFNILDAMGNSALAYLTGGVEKVGEVATMRAEGKDDDAMYSANHTSSSVKEGDNSEEMSPPSGRK